MSDIGSLINTRINLLAVGHPSLVKDYRDVMMSRGAEPNIYMFHKIDEITFDRNGCVIEKEKLILKVCNNTQDYCLTFDLTSGFTGLFSNEIYFTGEFEFLSADKRIRLYLTNENFYTLDALDIMTNYTYYPVVQEKELYDNRAPIELDTLYVGMAYGSDGNRNAFDRISEHPKLQEIMSEAWDEKWEEEIVISLWDVQSAIIIGMMGSTDNEKKGTEYLDNIFRGPLEDKQLISLTEAGIVYHLQPQYNTLLKKVFPDKNAKSYSEIYFREFDGISIEFGLEDHDIAIKSKDIILTEQNRFIEVKWLGVNDKEFFKRMVDGDIG